MSNYQSPNGRVNPYDVEHGYNTRHHETALQAQRYEPPNVIDFGQAQRQEDPPTPFVDPYALPPSQAYGGTHASPHPTVLANPVFLARIESVRKDIEDLTTHIAQISNLHQRVITSTDNSTSGALEGKISRTQILNGKIRDQIRYLETDAARSGGNAVKNSQIRNIKNQFKDRIQQFQREEVLYRSRYQEQIARQYKVIHPDADQAEVLEASQADWGDEGVFQAALNSNRSRTATSVLDAVRLRHREIQTIEKTLVELNELLQDLAEVVTVQDDMFKSADVQTDHVVKDTRNVNNSLDKSIIRARRTRKLKWCCCILVFILVIVLVALLIYFLKIKPDQEKAGDNSTPSASKVGFAGP